MAVNGRRKGTLSRLDDAGDPFCRPGPLRARRFGSLEISGGLWRTMARRGLLGWSIPAAFGGDGARFSDILPAVEAFVGGGGRPGLALSWMVHLIVGKVLIAGSGNGRQKKEFLPGMASGKRTVSIALSEPGAGSDPKRIRTTAVKKGRSYVLDGKRRGSPMAPWPISSSYLP